MKWSNLKLADKWTHEVLPYLQNQIPCLTSLAMQGFALLWFQELFNMQMKREKMLNTLGLAHISNIKKKFQFTSHCQGKGWLQL